MLTVDRVKRFDADDILHNPLIAAGAERATDIPKAPPPEWNHGPVVQASAIRCRPGFSLVGILLAARRSDRSIHV
jgi:hypothetical protein